VNTICLDATPWGATRIAYAERGTGVTLLLVHGFPLTHAMWRGQLDGLSNTFHVLAPDLPGFGKSPWPARRPRNASARPSDALGPVFSMSDYADTLDAFLRSLPIDEPVIFCGLSMGGYIAWSMVDRYPHRIAGLILCDTRAAADTPEQAAVRRRTAKGVLDEGTEPIAAAMIPKLFARETIETAPEIVEATRGEIVATDRRTVAAAQLGMAARDDATDRLASLHCPTLLLVGEKDPITPPEAMQRMSRSIPAAHYVVVPKAAHMAPLENPRYVNRAIADFARETGLMRD